jgi:fucose permease
MAQRNEIGAVYAAGVIQGLALVSFPAASAILTGPQYYGLSSTAYGDLFLPQAVMAVTASLLGAGLTRRLGVKRIYLLGLGANLIAMALFCLSQFAIGRGSLAYGMLLLATAALGSGFGLTVPALNTFAAAFFPGRVERAVLILNALLGVGTVLAPLLAAIFLGLHIWWGLPLMAGVLVLALLLFSLPLPLEVATAAGAASGRRGRPALPPVFWTFAAFALLYGICETINGNWAGLYMTQSLGATATAASLALTVFWATVTGGRVLFAAIEKRFPETRAYRLLPFVVAVAFVVTALLPSGSVGLGLLAFALAGLGCSALLPLTISFGQEDLTVMAASVAGGLIAFYQIGYGLAAFGVGSLEDAAGLGLNVIFGATAVVALALAALSFVIVRRHAAPRPAPAPEQA